MKTITQYTGELLKDDLIAIADGTYLHLGFFVGRGQKGSTQYYTMRSIIHWAEGNTKRKLPYKGYINTPPERRVIKISPDSLTEQYREMYEKCVEILKEII